MDEKPTDLQAAPPQLHPSIQPKLPILVAIILASALFGALLRQRGFDGAFSVWNVPGYGIPFLDEAVITGSAESYARGLDPAISNPFDPLQRPFNYPRIWYLLFRLPLTRALDAPIAIGIIALFLLAIVLFPRKATLLSESLLFLALVSPAAMLAYSRANVDLLILVGMVSALILVNRQAVAALVVVLIGVLVKIFPILGVGLFLQPKRNSALGLMSAAIVLSTFYFALTFNDLLVIYRNTPKGYQEAYGVAVLPQLLGQLASLPELQPSHMLFGKAVQLLNALLLHFPFLPYMFGLLLLAAVVNLGFQSRCPPDFSDVRDLRAFWMGSGIYIGTFLLGNNFDYRLMFLLLAVPQLTTWARQKIGRVTSASVLTIVLVFAALSELLVKKFLADAFAFGVFYAGILDQLVKWALFAALAFLFVSSVPAWFFADIGRLFRQPVIGRGRQDGLLGRKNQG